LNVGIIPSLTFGAQADHSGARTRLSLLWNPAFTGLAANAHSHGFRASAEKF
jgi:hypothetical protein